MVNVDYWLVRKLIGALILDKGWVQNSDAYDGGLKGW